MVVCGDFPTPRICCGFTNPVGGKVGSVGHVKMGRTDRIEEAAKRGNVENVESGHSVF